MSVNYQISTKSSLNFTFRKFLEHSAIYLPFIDAGEAQEAELNVNNNLLAWSQCHKSLSLQSQCQGLPSILRLFRWWRLRNGLTDNLLKLLLFKCSTSKLGPKLLNVFESNWVNLLKLRSISLKWPIVGNEYEAKDFKLLEAMWSFRSRTLPCN